MIVAANWKMNPTLNRADVLSCALANKKFNNIQRILFAPHPFLLLMKERLSGSDIRLGGQDCHYADSGAYTGDVSASMLQECGASMVLLGHSERRIAYGESNDLIAQKAKMARAHNLDVMICVGETEVERDDRKAEQAVTGQLQASIPNDFQSKHLVVAYEPVWAIGTGKVASPDDIASMHGHISSVLKEKFGIGTAPPILYGGSVSKKNAETILDIPLVSGALIGGASLDKDEFTSICNAASQFSKE